MLSYMRENGGNEKLMGWEGGITTREKLHGLEPTHPRFSVQNSSIPGPVLLNALIPETFQYFPTLTKEKKKE